MRIPKPRLRQVFEHTTSFKVKKPTGQTITIAKKGLSPSTIGRLRRFAQGGEVRNYQVGGEVPSLDSAAIAAEETKTAEAQPVSAEALGVQLPAVDINAPGIVAAQAARSSRRPVKASEATAADAETQARQTLEMTKYTASRPEPPASMTPVVPAAPSTITIINTPQPQPAAPAAPPPQTPAVPPAPVATPEPAAQPQRMKVAPDAAAPVAAVTPIPVPVAPIPVAAPVSNFVRTKAPQPFLNFKASSDMLSDEDRAHLADKSDAYKEAYNSVINDGGTSELAAQFAKEGTSFDDETPLTTQAAQAVAPAPVVPVAATPVAPVAAVAPAAIAPAPAAPAPAAPQLPDVLTDDQIEELVSVAPPAYQPAVRMAFVGQRNQQLVERRQAEQQAAAMAASERRMSDALVKVESDIAQIRRKRADIQGEIQAARNEGNVFSRMGVIEKIGTILAMGVAGFAAGYAGIPNYALQAFNQALDRDLERQRRKGDSLLNELKLVTATEEDAEQLYRGIAKEAVAIEAKRAELQATTQKSRAAYGAVAGKFALDAYKEIAEVESKLAGAEAALARAAGELTAEEKLAVELGRQKQKNEIIDLERRRVAEAERAHRAAEEARRKNLADKEEKERRERILNVGNIEVELARKTQATKIQRDLALRNQGIRALDDVVYTIENATPQSLANRLSDDYIKASAGIKAFKETFLTGATGADRAIAVTAGRVVDEALNNPLSFTKIALGQKTIALNSFLIKFKKGRETFIRNMALPGQDLAPALKALEEEDQYFSSRPKFGFQPVGGK